MHKWSFLYVQYEMNLVWISFAEIFLNACMLFEIENSNVGYP